VKRPVGWPSAVRAGRFAVPRRWVRGQAWGPGVNAERARAWVDADL